VNRLKLPYKEGVAGSNPASPTKEKRRFAGETQNMSDPEFIAQAEECQLTPAPLGADETTQLVNDTVATLSQYEDLVREAIEKHG
jgi:hypothetical protein